MNKTSISSVVCLDIIDFSKKSKTAQEKIKKQLQSLVNHAVVDIPEKNRMIVDTKHGAVITCSGPSESALEDALFIALTIRDEILNSTIGSEAPIYLLIGITLGSVRVTNNTKENQAPQLTGEGLDEVQRIMSFANPNQILVSTAYYDMASKLTLEIAQMFEKYDMHAYEHDIYAVRRLNEKAVVENAAAALSHVERPEQEPLKSPQSWHIYVLPALLALIMLFISIKWVQRDALEKLPEPFVLEEPVSGDITLTTDVPSEAIETAPEEDGDVIKQDGSQESAAQDKAKVVQKKPVRKPKAKTPSAPKTNKEASVISVDGNATVEQQGTTKQTSETNDENAKSTWDTIKESVTTGAEQTCTQAQMALNQCK